MKIAYTVCSLNRLGQVIVLGNSLLKHNADYTFIAALADEVDDRINEQSFAPLRFISLSALDIAQFKKFEKQYDVFELSCALKPYFGNYILQEYNPEILLYFDTDIEVYDNFKSIEEALEQNTILLSPHYTSPVPADGHYPLERDALNSGLYNGGFVGLKINETAKAFLAWWQGRLFDQGFNNVCEGMMVDQLWLNLVPLYFSQVNIFKHPGCNLAYWNMHERKLSEKNGKFYVNRLPLVFFHFSGFKISDALRISTHQNRYTAKNNPLLTKIFKEYERALTDNHFENYLSLRCYYGKSKVIKKHSFFKMFLINALASVGYKLEKIRKL